MRILAVLMSFLMTKEPSPLPYETAIRRYSSLYNVSAEVVAGVILQESGGNPWAFRYEHRFFEKYLDNKLPSSLSGRFNKDISFESEIRLRAFSFGLGQIMGQTAIENGFEGYLPELFVPEINIKFCAKILSDNLTYYKGDYRKALSAYNSGRGYVDMNGSTPYADRVIARIEKKEIGKLITL